MGLLGDYLTRKSRQEAEEKSNQLEAYKYVLTAKDDEVKPEAKQYALDQMMKTAGMKGPGKDLFTGLLGGLIKRKKDGAAKQEAPPSFEGPGVPGGQTGFSRVQATGADGLPETRVKPEMSAGEAPSTGMFYSTGEQQEMLRQRQEQADQHALDVKRQGIELTDKLTDAHSEAIYQQSIQTIDRMKDILPPERIHDMISAAIDARFKMKTQRTPATPAAEMKPVTIQHPDGTEVSAYPTGVQGQYRTGDGKTVTTTGEDKIFSERAPAQPKDELTGEPKSYEWAVKKKDDPKATPEEKKTADAIIKKWGQESTNRGIRIDVGQAAAAANAPVGNVAAPASPKQAPIERLNENQKSLVTFTENYLSGILGAGLGMGIAARERASKGMSLIAQLTGLPQTEIDARSEVRKADKKAFERLNLITQGNASLENALALHGDVLVNLRPSLPQGDVAKINEWLMSGARSFNVKGISDKAIRYGLALAAVRNEYARVISGGGMSIAQVPVEALSSAGALMREGFNTGNTAAMVAQMKNETRLKTQGYSKQLRELRQKVALPLIPELYGQKYEDIVGSNDRGGQQGGATHFVQGSDHWDIPADKVEAFKKAHPNAKAQ
jgi:hypothetical protein